MISIELVPILHTTSWHDLVFIFTQQIGKEKDALAVKGIKKKRNAVLKKSGNWL